MEDGIVSAVAEIVKDVTEDQVRQVLAAFTAVKEGDAVGTVMQDPKTGAIAVRITEDGVPQWTVTTLSGGQSRDMQPKLVGWTALTGG